MPIVAPLHLFVCFRINIIFFWWNVIYFNQFFTAEALNLLGLEGEGNMLFWPNNGRAYLMQMGDFLMEESSF